MRILIAYDGSIYADAAIQDLRRAGLPTNVEAQVVSVVVGLKPPSSEGIAAAEVLAQAACGNVQSYFPHWSISTVALWGRPAEAILELCSSWHPDLIVAGSHGRSLTGRFLLGSVSLELMQKAECSVRIVRSTKAPWDKPIRILAATDGSKQADFMMDVVARRSWPASTEVRVVSVLESLIPAGDLLESTPFASSSAFATARERDTLKRARLEDIAETSAKRLRIAGLAVSSIVLDGEPGKVIVDEANRWSADTVFVGARGLGWFDRFTLGSTSTHVVNHAPCTVEVVR